MLRSATEGDVQRVDKDAKDTRRRPEDDLIGVAEVKTEGDGNDRVGYDDERICRSGRRCWWR